MTVKTDLNVAPYYDDYDPAKKYMKVLYRPRIPVQARELTQVQDQLQTQIERFGRNIFIDGSIVEGCNITFNEKIPYIKILDNYVDNSPIIIENLKGKFIQSLNGLKAIIQDTVQGSVNFSPDLNTLYINYLNSSNDGLSKEFIEDEVLEVFDSNNVSYGHITIANNSISGPSNITGYGYSMSVADGVIFHKGVFSAVDKQSIVVSKYSNFPDKISIGFDSQEDIITSDEDPSLLDNALGYNNYSAPGAHRLKITPTLVIRETSSNETDSFFSIVDFVEGVPAIIRQDSQYATLGDTMAKRTDEADGNFIIDPFNIRVLPKYNDSGIRDDNLLKLEIDPGLAYVHGYRVETKGKLVSTIRRGNDVSSAPQQVVTTTLGNYIYVNEFSGSLNSNSTTRISLRDTASNSITNYISKGTPINSVTAPGSEIGSAVVIAVEYESGIPGTPSAKYRVYLSNIIMNSGHSFDSVKSIYFSDTTNALGDIVLDLNNSARIYENNLPSLVYSFNQKSIKTLKDPSNQISGQFDYYQTSDINFNSSGVASVTIPTYVGGINQLPYGPGVLDNNTEKDFIITVANTVYASNNSGTITVSGNNITGVGTSFTTNYMIGDNIRVANSSTSEIRQISTISNNTHMSVISAFNNSWSSASHSLAYVAGQTLPTYATDSNITINNSSSFTINLDRTFNSSFLGNVQYKIRRVSAAPARKILKTIYVKIDCATSSANNTGPWCLGVPDVLSIENAYLGTGYSVNNPDIKSYLKLDNGQKDTYYDLAYVKNNGASIASNSKLFIKLKAFVLDESAGIGFLSIDSYPIDDSQNTSNTIFTQDVPSFTSTSGNFYNLRNCIDFRNHISNTIPYIENVNTAISNNSIINPAITNTFSMNSYNPVIDSSFEADVNYYLARIDKVGFTTKGSVIVLEGTPSENPVPPSDIPAGLTIATINIPAYPTLTVDDAKTNITSITYKKNKRYTMADIGLLDNRLSQVEYYTALNALELSAKNLLITNAAGNNRMQNGILAEPFADFSISNTLDPNYRIAIDTDNSEARPIFKQELINLKYSTSLSTNSVLNGRVISLPYIENATPYISQPRASKTRNGAQDTLYTWVGQVSLNPTGDYQPDITINPDVTVTSDTYSNMIHLTDPWPTQWGNWIETAHTRTARWVGSGTLITDTSNQSRSGTKYSVEAKEDKYNFGSYVTDISLQPYCRPMAIKFVAYGLKPNTIMYAWMDDINVSEYCILTDSNYSSPVSEILKTDDNGALYGIYFLPAGTFRSGERQFKLFDVDNIITKIDSITTKAVTTYYGTNIAYSKNNINLNTISPQIVTNPIAESKTVITERFIPAPSDPLAQGFIVDGDYQGIFISSLDLYFQSKDPNLGITVMIRNMDNGYPGDTIINYASKHLTPSQINISEDATAITKVIFDSPVFLENGEYCIVAMPDGSNPGYNLWVGELGGTDITNNSPIYTISSCGNLFSSSQNSTWTTYQKERLKFNLNMCKFTSLSGTAILTNGDDEFISIANLRNSFKLSENVYPTTIASSNASISNTSNSIIVSNSSIYSVGNRIVVRDDLNSNINLGKIASIPDSTHIVVDFHPTFSSNTAIVGKLVANGNLKAITTSANNTNLILTNSTANSTYYFSNSQFIVGENSLAYADISSINNVAYNTLMPKLALSTQNDTSINFSMLGTANSTFSYISDIVANGLTFATENEFIDKERVVLSRTNEVLNKSGEKSLKIMANLTSGKDTITPFLDTIKLGAVTVHNLIEGDDVNNTIATSEISNGLATNKYISKTVVLAEGMDAEDLSVYVGGYWPADTDILVYAKFQNYYDSAPFENKAWTKLETLNQVRSSKINKEDFNEYLFNVPIEAPIDETAYLNSDNLQILRYVDKNGQIFDSFKKFAIKVVLLSSAGSHLVPRLTDIRAIATPSAA